MHVHLPIFPMGSFSASIIVMFADCNARVYMGLFLFSVFSFFMNHVFLFMYICP